MKAKEPKPLQPLLPSTPEAFQWTVAEKKCDVRGRALADRHYTRQSIGATMFTRPGYNLVLLAPDALFVWFRPKWESGIKGTERQDKLRAIECTHFRNESKALSSTMILAAEREVSRWSRANDVECPDGLITAVGIPQTSKHRGKKNPPGYCYLKAGWEVFQHPSSKRTDLVWLRKPLVLSQK